MEEYVKISTEEYNRLRDFHDKITSGQAMHGHTFFGIEYLTEKELIKKLENRIIAYEKIIHTGETKYSKNTIREWSIYKFLKARKNLRDIFRMAVEECAKKKLDSENLKQ